MQTLVHEVNRGTGYIAPPYARKLKIYTPTFFDLFQNMINNGAFISPTERNRNVTVRAAQSGTQQLQRKTEVTALWLWSKKEDGCALPLPPVPSTLTLLRIHYQDFNSVDSNQLPATLIILDLYYNDDLTTIANDALPETLQELKLVECSNLQQLPATLPPRLEVLNCEKTS